MASEIEVADFTSTLMVHYPFKHDPPSRERAWIASMYRELREFSGQVLVEAAQEIIRTRTDRRYPLPSECREACQAVRKRADLHARVAERPASNWTYKRDDDYAPWKTELADDLVRCDVGRQAAKEGWLLSLHDYARKHGKLPDPTEYPKLKQSAKNFEKAYARCIRGGWAQAKMLASLGDKMIAREKELSDMVLHGVERG